MAVDCFREKATLWRKGKVGEMSKLNEQNQDDGAPTNELTASLKAVFVGDGSIGKVRSVPCVSLLFPLTVSMSRPLWSMCCAKKSPVSRSLMVVSALRLRAAR